MATFSYEYGLGLILIFSVSTELYNLCKDKEKC